MDAATEVVSKVWRIQAYYSKQREWYFIGTPSDSLESARWYRDNCLRPTRRRVKFRIVEETMTRRVVDTDNQPPASGGKGE